MMRQAAPPVSTPGTWILVLPARADMIVVLNDAGETPLFGDADAARQVGLAEGLERCQALAVPANAELVSPTPYRPGMTFDAARAEARALLTTRGRRRLFGE
jgi:hypothetical protein